MIKILKKILSYFIGFSFLLLILSISKNEPRQIKRENTQTNKEEIILIYSSNDFKSDIYNLEMTHGNETARGKISSTFKISVNRRYIIAMRTNNPDTFMTQIAVVLSGWSGLTSAMSGEEIYTYMRGGNEPNYEYILNDSLGKSSQEGGYYTFYLNLSSFGHNNNISEMYMTLLQQGNPGIEFNDFIQDIFVYDITYITTQGETWYNYQAGGTDPAEIQTAYDKGYSDAIASGTGLNWMQSAFNTIVNILNIEILPNIKISYLVAIPLLIELVLFVLRFIK